MSTSFRNNVVYLTGKGYGIAEKLKPYEVEDFVQTIYEEAEVFKKYLERVQTGETINPNVIQQYKDKENNKYFVGLKDSHIVVKTEKPLINESQTKTTGVAIAGLIISAISLGLSLYQEFLKKKKDLPVQQVVNYELTTLIINSKDYDNLVFHSSQGGLSTQECPYIVPSKILADENEYLYPLGIIKLRSTIATDGNTIKGWVDCAPGIRYGIFRGNEGGIEEFIYIVTNKDVYLNKPRYFNAKDSMYDAELENPSDKHLNFGIYACLNDKPKSILDTMKSSEFRRKYKPNKINDRMVASPDEQSLTPTAILFVE